MGVDRHIILDDFESIPDPEKWEVLENHLGVSRDIDDPMSATTVGDGCRLNDFGNNRTIYCSEGSKNQSVGSNFRSAGTIRRSLGTKNQSDGLFFVSRGAAGRSAGNEIRSDRTIYCSVGLFFGSDGLFFGSDGLKFRSDGLNFGSASEGSGSGDGGRHHRVRHAVRAPRARASSAVMPLLTIVAAVLCQF